MIEISEEIPDMAVLFELAPEELACKVLFAMRKRGEAPSSSSLPGNGKMFNLNNLVSELWSFHRPAYDQRYQSDVTLVFSEAWAWLEAQGLLVPAGASNGQNGWRVLSRRARQMESAVQFADFKVARLLPKEILHFRIADRVWGDFMRGAYASAVFQAMKGVEVAVREAGGFGNDLVGVTLMRKAFAPQDGPLTDLSTEGGERQGRMDLFAGAMASYKNPHSHRDVNLDNPYEALEIIYLANQLLRIVDVRVADRAMGQR